ncbi:MAG: hypothetical protein ACT4O1_07125 [Gemmatimonadota bacterium]
MADQPPISRRDLPAVVKRASELAAVADDADEELPEAEVIRIAAELGLAERHVRQALFEGVREEGEQSLLDRQFGTPRILATRAVQLPVERARRALEDYFVTQEYMQIVRRQASALTFEPAGDAVSKVARTFQRSSRHHLASAIGVEVAIRPLETDWTHVRIRAVYQDDRRRRVTNGIVGGLVLGIPLAGAASVVFASIANGAVGSQLAVAIGSLCGIATFAGVMAAHLASIRNRYRRWRERTQNEAEALLDRLEGGDELRPPPSPWLRKLQIKFGGEHG